MSEKRDLWVPLLLVLYGLGIAAWNVARGEAAVGVAVAFLAVAAGLACLPLRVKRGQGTTARFALGVAVAAVPAVPGRWQGLEQVLPWWILAAAFLLPVRQASPPLRRALLAGAALFAALAGLSLAGVLPRRVVPLLLAGAGFLALQVVFSRPRRTAPAPPGPRICVFGGTFDPFHRGHRALAEAALKGNERLLVVVAGTPPHKPPGREGEERTPFFHRVAMARLGCEGLPRTEVLELEGKRPGPSYTVDTLDVLRKSHPPDARFRLLLGADMFQTFPTWHDWEGILERATLLVAARPGFDLEPPPEFEGRNVPVEVLAAPEIDVSSQALREDLAEARDVGDRLSPAVRAYVLDHGLYRSAAAPAPPATDA